MILYELRCSSARCLDSYQFGIYCSSDTPLHKGIKIKEDR